MLYSKLFSLSILSVCSLVLISYPIECAALENAVSKQMPSTLSFTYDDVLDILDLIENEDLEEYAEEEDLERIIHFLIFLSRQGVLPGDEAEQLEKDILEFMGDDFDSYANEDTFDDIGVTIQKVIKSFPRP